MDRDNPAVYECRRGRGKVHSWERNADRTATCQNCRLTLTAAQADDVWQGSQIRVHATATDAILNSGGCQSAFDEDAAP